MIHERNSGHFRRQYSARAKRAGEAMIKVLRDFAEPLNVQDSRGRLHLLPQYSGKPGARLPVQRRCAGSRGGSGCGCKS